MTKKNAVNPLKKLAALEDDFDFSDSDDLDNNLDSEYHDELMTNMMGQMIDASNNQLLLAVELTKLALKKNTAKEINEDDIFSTFKKAAATVSESFPLKKLWECLGK